MTIDEWTKFVESISLDKHAEDVISSGDISQILALARSKGFEFTEQDLADGRIHELSDKMLDQVSGGVAGVGFVASGFQPRFKT